MLSWVKGFHHQLCHYQHHLFHQLLFLLFIQHFELYSQSHDQDQPINEHDEHDEMVRFVALEFDLEEVNMDDNAIMYVKQYKMLNVKFNFIHQFLNDSAGKTTVSGEEVEFLLKSQDSRTRTLFDNTVKGIDKHLATQCCTFNHEIEKLHDFSRGRHEIS